MPPVRILFLCTGNSCRSQMAEGWARHLGARHVESYSAGVSPGALDVRAVAVMSEVGIDISTHEAKHLSTVMDVPFDLVVTVCDHAAETCPLFPGSTEVVHRGFEDPPRLAEAATDKEEALGHYRRIRDEIRTMVEEVLRTEAMEGDD